MLEQNKQIKKVAIYTRVSTEEQAHEGFSLDAQLEKLRKYCELKEWKIVGEYTDPGFSGRKCKNRPAYQQMFNDIDQWDALLVIKMDRIHRNQKNFTAMIEQLQAQDKDFVSMQESFDTSSAMGRFVMFIIQQIAQLESEQIAERVSLAMDQKARDLQAGFVGHRTAFGYRWDPDKQQFNPIAEKLDIVKKAFRMYLDGFSFRQIGLQLGKSDTTIRYYLNNSFYAGFYRWTHHFKRIPGLDPLIDIDTWNQVQTLMRSKCKTHHYEPLIIKPEKEQFSLSREKRRAIPIINRAKRNFTY